MKPVIEKQVYGSIRQADSALKKNKILNLEISKALNRHRSQCYMETIKEAENWVIFNILIFSLEK